jgi:hypothetical protein
MSEQRRFGESDHEPLKQDDILQQAINEWRDEMPTRDLWQGVASRLREQQQPVVATQRFVTFTITQLAVAASLLMAVASGVTWMIANPPAALNKEEVIQAYGVTDEVSEGQIVQANFADAQFNAAVSDLERILRDDRDRLDPRTVLIIERNLKAIDDAINEARMALNDDPANPYLNSHLADARRRKLDLLRHATTLASGGD